MELLKPARRSLAACTALFCALALPRCGGDDGRPATGPATRPPDAPPATSTAPGGGEPGARTHRAPVPGGERPVQIPASFTLRGGRILPRELHAPPFLAVRVTAADADGRAHVLTIEADRTYRLRVPAGGRASLELPGQQPGRYRVSAGAATATLVVGGEPG